MIIYMYAAIGIEIFNTNYNEYHNEENPYAWTNYADFNSFGSAFLLLFQVVVGPRSYNLIIFYIKLILNYYNQKVGYDFGGLCCEI